MNNLTTSQLIKKYGLLENKGRAKAFGQHFLTDPNLLHKIASCALPFDCDVVEIGPGPGGLTREISELAKDHQVFCIEKDRTLQPLHEDLSLQNVQFVYGNALEIMPQTLTNRDIIILSNLPYNVGTQIFLNWTKDLSGIRKLVLMFQKEVADRIISAPGSKTYGRLSIISQLLFDVEHTFDIAPEAFTPPPKVVSSVIKLVPKPDRPRDLQALSELTNTCFQARRKTIFSILKHKKYILAALETCEIDPKARPETISPSQFLLLSKLLGDRHAEF